MKERLTKLKEQILQNKKKTAMITLAVLLLLGAGGFGIVSMTADKTDPAAKTTQTKVKEKDAAEDKKDTTAETKKKTDEADKETSSDNSSKASTGVSNNTNTGSSSNNTNTGASGNTNTGSTGSGSSGTGNTGAAAPTPAPEPEPEPVQPAHSHNYNTPVYGTEQKWVVDKAAWTETVNEPIYEMIEKSICNGCGTDITGNPWGHIDAQLDAGIYTCGGYHSEWIQVQTGTNSYTVPHAEEGHWESVQVVTGHQCSCGAVQ